MSQTLTKDEMINNAVYWIQTVCKEYPMFLAPSWVNEWQSRAAQLLREAETDTPKSPVQTCNWTRNDDEESSSYDTACGSAYFFIDGDLDENEVKFCFHCGKPIST
jgi:hypothetical protein